MYLSLDQIVQGIFLYLKKIRDYLLDAIFPIFCVECQQEGEWWCYKCQSKHHYRPIIFYPSSEIGINSALAYFLYNELYPTGKLLRCWKYGHVQAVEDAWFDLVNKHVLETERWLQMFDKKQTIGIIFIPLHPRRQRDRGFNQSEILAELFLKVFQKDSIKLEIITGLKRIRYTKQQAKLPIEKRAQNLLNAFRWSGGILPKQIILVDDVFTNGYTMGECAKVLRQHGVEKIGGLVLAKG